MTDFIKQDGHFFEPIKVGKRGKLFELLVQRLEEFLKIDSEVKILPDYKIKNLEGFERQFDVYILSKVQEYDIEIAIECKEYGSEAVDVEKIESFQCKCQRIPSINKKVFVSQTGYTKGAVAAANIYGITLLNIEDMSKFEKTAIEQLTKPFNFYLQKRYIKLEHVSIESLDGNRYTLQNLDCSTIEFVDYSSPISLRQFCTSYMVNLPLEEWKSILGSNNPKIPTKCGYRVYPDLPMIIGCEHTKSQALSFDFIAYVYEERIELDKQIANSYKQFNSDAEKAQFLKMEGKSNNGQEAIAEVILSKDRPTFIVNVNYG